MNLKIKAFMKVGTDDEIDEKDAAISSDHFLYKIFGGSTSGKFQDIWVFLKAVLNFSELILFPFFSWFLLLCERKRND